LFGWVLDKDDEAISAFSLALEIGQTNPSFQRLSGPPKFIPRWDSPEPERYDEPQEWHTFGQILRREWFRRVWVLQEVGLASSALVLCGKAELDWDVFACVMRLVLERGSQLFRDQFNLNPEAALLIDELFVEGRHRTFLHVLQQTRSHLATVPRDKVYALLMHLTTQSSSSPVTIVKPNYTKPVQEVYTEIALLLFEQMKTMEPLSAVFHDEATIEEEEFPTWVPRWNHDVKTKNLGLSGMFSAGYHHGNSVQIRRNLGNVLVTRGIIFDSVTWVSRVMETRDFGLANLWRQETTEKNMVEILWTKVGLSKMLYPNGEDLRLALSLTLVADSHWELPNTTARSDELTYMIHFVAYLQELRRYKR
jgi:hypothetical protein